MINPILLMKWIWQTQHSYAKLGYRRCHSLQVVIVRFFPSTGGVFLRLIREWVWRKDAAFIIDTVGFIPYPLWICWDVFDKSLSNLYQNIETGPYQRTLPTEVAIKLLDTQVFSGVRSFSGSDRWRFLKSSCWPRSALAPVRTTRSCASRWGTHIGSTWGFGVVRCGVSGAAWRILPMIAGAWLRTVVTRSWFQIFSMFIPTWVNDPIWLIFFKCVETTNLLITMLSFHPVR